MVVRNRIAQMVCTAAVFGAGVLAALALGPEPDDSRKAGIMPPASSSSSTAAAVRQGATGTPPAPPAAVAAGMQEGLEAYRDGYFEIALRVIGKIAESDTLAPQFRADARYWLGVIQDFGLHDRASAVAHYAIAAELGHVMAQLRLSEAYFLGIGAPLDYERAYMWTIIAATHVHNEYEQDIAIGNRDDLIEIMPYANIARAERMAREWLARNGQWSSK